MTQLRRLPFGLAICLFIAEWGLAPAVGLAQIQAMPPTNAGYPSSASAGYPSPGNPGGGQIIGVTPWGAEGSIASPVAPAASYSAAAAYPQAAPYVPGGPTSPPNASPQPGPSASPGPYGPLSVAQATGPGMLPAVPEADGTSSFQEMPAVVDAATAPAPEMPPPGAIDTAAQSRKYQTPTPLYASDEPWSWQLLPDGLMYHSYLAGGREPRIGSQWFYKKGFGWLWDITLGARVGILRYGTEDALMPQGWQLDIEGAGMPRLDIEHERDLAAVDFRFGVPLTMRQGPWEFKVGYYHLSSHLGDEWIVRYPDLHRVNYVRDNTIIGLGWRPNYDWRFYAEVGYAFYTSGGADPWEIQFGIEYSPARPTTVWGLPFIATNVHLREENNYSGNFVVQAGWQWRGATGKLFRIGAHYFNGLSDQYQFVNQFEDQIGAGAWYDF